MPKFNMNWIYIIAGIVLLGIYFTQGGTENSSIKTEASYQQFQTMVDKGYASKIVVNKEQNTLQMYVKPEHIREVFKKGVEQTEGAFRLGAVRLRRPSGTVCQQCPSAEKVHW